TTTSDDGLTKTIALSVTGPTGVTTLNEIDATTLAADGSKTRTLSVNNSGGTLVGKRTDTTSDDGLTSTISLDTNGDGRTDITDATVIAADGSSTETVTVKNTATGALISQDTVTTTADGHKVTTVSDSDGNGLVDRTEVVTKNADGSVTDTISGSSVFNAPGFNRVIQTANNTDGGVTVTTSDYSSGGTLLKQATA